MAEKLEIEKPLQKWNKCIAVTFDFGQNLKYSLYVNIIINMMALHLDTWDCDIFQTER